MLKRHNIVQFKEHSGAPLTQSLSSPSATKRSPVYECGRPSRSRKKAVKEATRLHIHSCTIFLCSLDVRNIVQGGDPLYLAVNHKQGCGGHNFWGRL